MNSKHSITLSIAIATTLILSAITGIAYAFPMQSAFAAGAAGTLDPNGIERFNPLASGKSPFGDSVNLSFDSEYYIADAKKNFRTDGSMRIDWNGKPNPMTDTDGVFLAGYFNIDLGGASSGNDCTANPLEEVSMKMNGGPHNDNNPSWADTMDSGSISFNGDRSRLRTEESHPDYSGSYAGRSLSGGWPIQSTNICSVPGGWVGVAAFKINVDKNGDGTSDAVRIMHYVDESGLDLSGKPQNKWELVYFQEFAVPNGLAVKSMLQPYVCTIGQCAVHQETIRIDGQSLSKWQSTTNPPYKFVTYKELVVDGSSTPNPEPNPNPNPNPNPEPTPTPTTSPITMTFSNVVSGQTLRGTYEVHVKSSNTGDTENIKLYVDGTKFIKTESSSPYEFDVNTRNFADGTHTLKAVLLDENGLTNEKTISVKFDN